MSGRKITIMRTADSFIFKISSWGLYLRPSTSNSPITASPSAEGRTSSSGLGSSLRNVLKWVTAYRGWKAGLQDTSLHRSRAGTRNSPLVVLTSPLPTGFAYHRNRRNFQKNVGLPVLVLLLEYHADSLLKSTPPREVTKLHGQRVGGRLETVGREGQQDRLGKEGLL